MSALPREGFWFANLVYIPSPEKVGGTGCQRGFYGHTLVYILACGEVLSGASIGLLRAPKNRETNVTNGTQTCPIQDTK